MHGFGAQLGRSDRSGDDVAGVVSDDWAPIEFTAAVASPIDPLAIE